MLSKIWEFLKNNKILIVPLVLGGIIGACLFPIKNTVVETKEVVKEVQVTTTNTKELMAAIESLKVELQKSKDSQVDEKYHKVITETTSKDGSKTKQTTIDKNIDSHVKETETKTEVQVVQVEKQVIVTQTQTIQKEVTTEKIVKNQSEWRVGVLAGVSPQFSPTIQLNNWVVGGEVEKRLIGPFWLGIWGAGTANGQGLGGVKLGVEF